MITLASKRYTIAAYGTTLDSRYPEGGTPPGTVLVFENFDAYTLPGAFGIAAQLGGTVSMETTGAYGGSGKSVKGALPIGETMTAAYGTIAMSAYNTDHAYIRFRAKMPSAQKGGIKFLKIFGKDDGGGGYANFACPLDYDGNGDINQVGFGDGTTNTNDTANVIQLNGGNPSYIGRSYGTAVVSTPVGASWPSTNWGTSWHLFEIYWKYNSGSTALNEVADGACTLKIDGVTYIEATGLLNSHYSNIKQIKEIGIFGYQDNLVACDLWYDNIEIATDNWGDSAV